MTGLITGFAFGFLLGFVLSGNLIEKSELNIPRDKHCKIIAVKES